MNRLSRCGSSRWSGLMRVTTHDAAALTCGPYEAFIGGRRKNMPKAKGEAMTGRGTVGKRLMYRDLTA